MTRDTESGEGYEDDGLFRTVMFGYDRAQVDEYVNAICDELHVLSLAVKRLNPVEQELAAAHTEIRRLQGAVAAATPGASASARIVQMLRLAEDEAAVLRDQAQRDLERARRDADGIRRAAKIDTEHVAASRRRENQRLREDIVAGAHAEAARILAEANAGDGLAFGSGVGKRSGRNARPAEPAPVNGNAPVKALPAMDVAPMPGSPNSGAPIVIGAPPVNGSVNGNPVNGKASGNGSASGTGAAAKNRAPSRGSGKGANAEKRATTPPPEEQP